MLITLLLVLLGIAVGLCLRKTTVPGFLEHCIMPVVWVLLFLLGLRIGGNPELMAALPRLGVVALLFTLAGIGGSFLVLRLVWRWLSPVLPDHPAKAARATADHKDPAS